MQKPCDFLLTKCVIFVFIPDFLLFFFFLSFCVSTEIIGSHKQYILGSISQRFYRRIYTLYRPHTTFLINYIMYCKRKINFVNERESSHKKIFSMMLEVKRSNNMELAIVKNVYYQTILMLLIKHILEGDIAFLLHVFLHLDFWCIVSIVFICSFFPVFSSVDFFAVVVCHYLSAVLFLYIYVF